MCNFYIMYYSNSNLLQYSGGDCGEQNHPNIFKNFPSNSDTPLVHSSDSKATVMSEQTTHSSVVTSEEQSTQADSHVEIPTTSVSHDADHEIGISNFEFGEEESPNADPKSSSNKDNETKVDESPTPTETVSQGVSKEMVNSPTKESIPVLPVVSATSEPVTPLTQSRNTEELHVVSNWPSLTEVESSKLGQATGVAVDSKGQVVVFHRGSRTWDDKYVTDTGSLAVINPWAFMYLCSLLL